MITPQPDREISPARHAQDRVTQRASGGGNPTSRIRGTDRAPLDIRRVVVSYKAPLASRTRCGSATSTSDRSLDS